VYTAGKPAAFYDPNKQFGSILKGTWAPYPLCASYYSINPGPTAYPSRVFGGPAFDGRVWDNDAYFKSTYAISNTPNSGLSAILAGPDEGNTDIRKLSSVVVVFTRDKSKWTRCPVLEMQEKSYLSEGHVPFFAPRGHLSVDKQGIPYGNPNNQSGYNPTEASMTSTMSMGWFPGYAVNIETGERLNMVFGEDSYQKENNGDDMMWNPTSKANTPYPYAFGGKHFVYVMAGNTIASKFTQTPIGYTWEAALDGSDYGVGRYDKGARAMNILTKFFNDVYSNGGTVSGNYMSAFEAFERDIMWASIPMPSSSSEFKDPSAMPSDVKFQINVSKPYRYGYSGVATYTSQLYSDFNKMKSVNSPSNLTTDVKANPLNNNFPLYSFNTNDMASQFGQASVAKSALDEIRVVPNPYYGSSAYENNRIDNRVRITNLPNKCSIKIFTMNGTLVRTITRDVSGQEDEFLTGDTKQRKRVSYTDWDLKNQNNITVASGLYIFYIDAPGIGEKIVKWFGVMRPLDVQNY
jgi:hypothetical protein